MPVNDIDIDIPLHQLSGIRLLPWTTLFRFRPCKSHAEAYVSLQYIELS